MLVIERSGSHPGDPQQAVLEELATHASKMNVNLLITIH